MPGKFEAPRGGPDRRRRRRRGSPLPLVLAVVAVLVVCGLLLVRCRRDDAPAEPTTVPTVATQAATEPAPTVTATATVVAQGDLLMHGYLFTGDSRWPSAAYVEEGVYDFSSIFTYIASYIRQADYAAANLETTFAGDAYPYSGNPNFNCPDALADALVSAGYDLLLTANNHCADTTAAGIRSTLERVRSRGLATLGTRLSEQEDRSMVVELNGIRIGLLCYTYAGGVESGGRVNFNLSAQTTLSAADAALVNYFTNNNLECLYTQVSAQLEALRADGAEAVIAFLHWGTEYQLSPDANQRAIAQRLCDLGVDAIIGSHPHVVQPVELLTSTADPAHRTVCFYSLGNAVSNQRKEQMNMDSGHTEDGLLASVTFQRYSDGTVAQADADALATWVNKYQNAAGKWDFPILPLDDTTRGQWQSLYGLTDDQYTQAQASYDRTQELIAPGLAACRTAPGQVG